MMQPEMPICNTCGEQVGFGSDGTSVFVSCHECNFPICKSCLDYEIKEGHTHCIQCGSPYDHGIVFLILFFGFLFFVFYGVLSLDRANTILTHIC